MCFHAFLGVFTCFYVFFMFFYVFCISTCLLLCVCMIAFTNRNAAHIVDTYMHHTHDSVQAILITRMHIHAHVCAHVGMHIHAYVYA
jgi:hypothetical protein